MSGSAISNGPTSILVASIGSDLATLSDADFGAYSESYPSCRRETVKGAPQLIEMLSGGFHLVHLLCRLSKDGLIADEETSRVPCSRLLDEAYAHGTVALFFGSENSTEAYLNGVRISGKRINIVMTLDRQGAAFGSFLFDFATRLAASESIVQAWNKATHGNVPRNKLPKCIFAAGLPNALLLP